jgi:hypothetical protein
VSLNKQHELINTTTSPIFYSTKRSDRPGAHPASRSTGTGGCFPGVKRPERKVNPSPSSSAEVTNEWSYTYTPHTCVYGVDMGKKTFLVRYAAFTERETGCGGLIMTAVPLTPSFQYGLSLANSGIPKDRCVVVSRLDRSWSKSGV